MRIFIATGTSGPIDPFVQHSVTTALENFARHGHEVFRWKPWLGLYIDQVRNQVTRKALDLGADVILYWDADQLIHCTPASPNLAELFDLGPVVGAAYINRRAPELYTATWIVDGKAIWISREAMLAQKEPFPAYWIGTGALWVRREVFDKVTYPWFMSGYAANGDYQGEDVYFCEQVRAAGIPILCQPEIQTGHLTTIEFCHRSGTKLPLGCVDQPEQYRVQMGDKCMSRPLP